MEATALSIGKSVLSGALGYANSAVAEEVALQLGVARDQAFIKDELEMMLSFLMAAHEEGDRHKVNETWVRQVRVVAYDVEDSLMDFTVRVQKQSCWRWRTLRDRRHVAMQMKDLRAKVEDVSQRNLRYRPIMGSTSKTATAGGDSSAAAAAMFGINEARYAAAAAKQKQLRLDLTQLINNGVEDLGVIAVWGTSGNVGNVSLIWEAYENSDTRKNFPCRAWVRVVHPLKPEEFIQSLLEEFRTDVGANYLLQTKKTGQELAEEFNRYVNEKRCLIVLNDLSTIEEWNQVKKCFPINKNGSRIVVSTTDVEVASLCVGQNSSFSELKQLSAYQTIYVFYNEPIARPSVQISTMPDPVKGAGDEDENTRTKSSQDITYSAESMSSSMLPASEIEEDQSKDADGKIQEGHTPTNMTAWVTEESQLVKREGEKKTILDLILNHSDKQFEVIAVCGMGGIGKTTLVTDVYQRQELKERFTKRAFVTVLRPFKLQELLRSIAIQLGANPSEKTGVMDFACGKENDYASMSVGSLIIALGGLSQDCKCLIVLEDLLYTTEWDTIIEAFREIKQTSWTVVITTRQKDIAEHCCDQKIECIHELNLLKAEEARKLFIEKVFKNTIDLNKEYPELIEPTKLILNKCDGLPLAIVTIGGFLAEQETKSAVEWRKLNDHIGAELETNPKIERIRVVLMKSYDGLPYYLKPCFLYMSIFPEDYNISRRRLVRRWAAEGYTAEVRDKSCMEVADSYFEELFKRSMILPTREKTFSRQKSNSCKLHDLIWDISISMSMKENLVFRLEEGCSSNARGTVRHLAISINWEGDKGEFESIVELSRIRSLTVFGVWKSFYICDKMRFLRVLDLEDTEGLANHCLEHIGKILHLRYLSLRWCYKVFCLPDSVGNLSELEVLDIKGTRIQVLPKTIVRLRKLPLLENCTSVHFIDPS